MRRITAISVLAVAASAMAAGSASAVTASSAWLAKPTLGSLVNGSLGVDSAQAVGPDGWTTLVYSDLGDGNRLKAVRIQPNGKYGTPVLVSGAGVGDDGWDPAIAVDKSGNGIIAFAGKAAGEFHIRVRRFSGLTTKFKLAAVTTTPAPSSGTNPNGYDNQSPSVALSPDGTATLVWQTGATPKVAEVRLGTDGSIVRDLGTALCKANSISCESPHVFTASTGISTVVWTEKLFGASESTYRVNQINAFNELAAADSQTIADASRRNEGLDLAQSSNGSVVAAWTSSAFGVGPYKVSAKRISSAGVPGSRQDLEAGSGEVVETPSSPRVAVNSSGAAIVTWIRNYGTVNPGPVVVFKRLSSTGVEAAGDPVSVKPGVGIDRVAVALASSGAATLFIGKGKTEVSLVSITPKNGSGGTVTLVPPSTGKPAVQGTFFDPDLQHDQPLVALGNDGTLAVTWLFVANGGSRQFVSQISSSKPALARLKFPARFRHGQAKGQVTVNSTKYATAVVTIAKSGRQKFRTRVTRVAVPAGSTTVAFDTRGLLKGKYTVTVQVVDFAGLSAARTATLLVTS